MLKRTTKIFFLTLILTAISALFFIPNNFYKNIELNNEYFYSYLYLDEPNIPESKNLSYSIIGITAPENIENFHEYGVMVLKNALNNQALPEFNSTDTELKYINNSDQDICLWDQSDKENCMDDEQIKELIDNNAVLLIRYIGLHKFSSMSMSIFELRNDGLLIRLHRMFLAFIKQLIEESKIEMALELLSNDIRFWKSIAKSNGTWIQKYSILVALNEDLRLISLLTELGLFNFYNYMDALFEPIGIQNWNINNIFRVEFRVIELDFCIKEGFLYEQAKTCLMDKSMWFYQRENTLNSIFDYIKKNEKTIDSNPENVRKNCRDSRTEKQIKVMSWLDRHIFNYKGNKIYDKYINYNNQNLLCDFLKSAHRTDASLILLKHYVEIVKNEMDDISEIININDNNDHPYPFVWNLEKNTIAIDKDDFYEPGFKLKLPLQNQLIRN